MNSQRERDRAILLQVIREFGPISRVGIHRLTNLRANTISDITQELLQGGQILDAGPSNNPTGRKQTLLDLNVHHGCVVAIEYDGERLVGLLCDMRGNIVERLRQPTRRDAGSAGLLEQLLTAARQLAAARPPGSELVGIGLADMGTVHPTRGVVRMSSQIPFWHDVSLVEVFAREFSVPIHLRNGTRCRANAERVLGAAKGLQAMAFVEYGSGIGATLVDRLHTASSELGHIRIGAERAPCSCGGLGCLEALASIGAIRKRYLALVQAGGQPLEGRPPEDVTGWDVLQAASEGHHACALLVEEVIGYLAQGLATLVCLLDPKVIVLDSRLSIAGPDFLAQLLRQVRLLVLPHLSEDLEIRYGSVGDDSGALGIACIVLDALFLVPELKPPQHWIDASPSPIG